MKEPSFRSIESKHWQFGATEHVSPCHPSHHLILYDDSLYGYGVLAGLKERVFCVESTHPTVHFLISRIPAISTHSHLRAWGCRASYAFRRSRLLSSFSAYKTSCFIAFRTS